MIIYQFQIFFFHTYVHFLTIRVIMYIVLLWASAIKIRKIVPQLYWIRTTAEANQQGHVLQGKYVFQP